MEFLAGFIRIIAGLLNIVVKILYFLIIARVIFSWINLYALEPLIEVVYRITEPVLRPLRIVFRISNIGIDLSPLIAFILLFLIERFIINGLYTLSARL